MKKQTEPEGNKMISFTVRLHTKGLRRGHAWTTGTLRMHENLKHGIKATKSTHINIANMAQELAAEGVHLHQRQGRVMPEWMQKVLHEQRQPYQESRR
jgi:hypothetical protein